MRIVVCLKPVPDPAHWAKISLDPVTRTLRREGVPTIVNPLDRHALTEALRLAEESQGEVVAISMAPPSAAESLRDVLAMGAHRAILLSDRAFAGADSLATAYVLAAGIRKLGEFDLILCGAHSLDGSTAQVGPELAELLGIPHAIYANRIEQRNGTLRVRSRLENGYMLLEMPLPALVTVVKELNTPRGITLMGLVSARRKQIVTWGREDLDVVPERLGLAGSPTQIADVFMVQMERRREMLSGAPSEAVDALLDRLRGEGVLPSWRGQR